MSLEVTDFLEQLTDVAKHDLAVSRAARIAGQEEGQEQIRVAVLKWAASFGGAVSPEMRHSLIEAMDKATP